MNLIIYLKTIRVCHLRITNPRMVFSMNSLSSMIQRTFFLLGKKPQSCFDQDDSRADSRIINRLWDWDLGYLMEYPISTLKESFSGLICPGYFPDGRWHLEGWLFRTYFPFSLMRYHQWWPPHDLMIPVLPEVRTDKFCTSGYNILQDNVY